MAFKDAIVTIDNATHLEPVKEKIIVSEQEIQSTERSRNGSAIARTTVIPANLQLDNTLTKTGKFIYVLLENRLVRYSIYIIPVATLLAIPLILFATKYSGTTIDSINILGLFIYIEVVWLSLWLAKLIAFCLPFLFQGFCGIISTGIRKYSLLLHAVEVPMSIFIWSIMALCWIPLIYTLDRDYYLTNRENILWIHILRNVMKASVGSAALLLAEKILMQMISVNYHGTQYRDKIKDIKYTTGAIDCLYAASLKKYYDHHPDFIEEDYDIHDTTNVQKILRTYSADQRVRRVFGDIHYFGERLVAAFGNMASNITGEELLKPTATHAIVDAALERRVGAEALARRIFKSLRKPDADAIFESDIVEQLGPDHEEQAAFIFAQLDKDGNGDICLEEMIMLVVGNSRNKKDLWKSSINIKDALKVLDRIVSFFVFIIVALIYSAFFSTFLADNYKNVVTLLSASAFALGQTVGEFNSACMLVFVKHPYDVGDRVNMNDVEYEVARISLLYTVFRRVDTDTLVQVANSIISNLWIDNVSRSKAMKERLQFSVSAGTSFTDIEALRSELQSFVTAPEHYRDYQNDVEIQLVSVGDLKQLDLRVEIRHKSNWSNEQLRQYRRSKFMCALLSAMRKVGIESPSGSSPGQGTINSPNYSVAVSEDTAKTARAQYDEKVASKRREHELAAPRVPAQIGSSGLEILPSLGRGFSLGPDGQLTRTAAGLGYRL